MDEKILIVEDEKDIARLLDYNLKKEGYRTVLAHEGSLAPLLAAKERPGLIILDLMLPEISGWDVCRMIRKESDIPIIMLTARDEVTDKIIGLEMGADDYVTKPFDTKELVSRVKAILRRVESKTGQKNIIQIADLYIDIEKRQVRRNEISVELTPNEFDILRVMAEIPGRVFSRMQLLDKVQGDAYEGYERTIDSHIKNLRKKIEADPEHPRYVITVHGVGYKLEET